VNPKLAYLIDERDDWGEPADWKFYAEDDVPSYKLEYARKGTLKRIVYWELEDA
jgi:hypothetical protein